MLLCKGCEQLKPDSDFYKSIRTYCRPCWRAKVKANREAKAEYYRKFDRERANRPDRVAMRAAYAKTDQGRATLASGKRAWQSRNPKKRSAHVILGNAIRNGKVIKPSRCSRCGSADRIHGHHRDYSRPLDVEWLCHHCHRAEHKALEGVD